VLHPRRRQSSERRHYPPTHQTDKQLIKTSKTVDFYSNWDSNDEWFNSGISTDDSERENSSRDKTIYSEEKISFKGRDFLLVNFPGKYK
jgi:hypothetical protein